MSRVVQIADITGDEPVVLKTVRGRSAILHGLLLVYGDRIDRAGAGRITFHFGSGEKVKVEFVEQLAGN